MKYLSKYKLFENKDIKQDIEDIFISEIRDDFPEAQIKFTTPDKRYVRLPDRVIGHISDNADVNDGENFFIIYQADKVFYSDNIKEFILRAKDFLGNRFIKLVWHGFDDGIERTISAKKITDKLKFKSMFIFDSWIDYFIIYYN